MLHLTIIGLAFGTLGAILGLVLLLQTERRHLRPVGGALMLGAVALVAISIIQAT